MGNRWELGIVSGDRHGKMTDVPAHGANAESVILPENGGIEEWNAV